MNCIINSKRVNINDDHINNRSTSAINANYKCNENTCLEHNDITTYRVESIINSLELGADGTFLTTTNSVHITNFHYICCKCYSQCITEQFENISGNTPNDHTFILPDNLNAKNCSLNCYKCPTHITKRNSTISQDLLVTDITKNVINDTDCVHIFISSDNLNSKYCSLKCYKCLTHITHRNYTISQDLLVTAIANNVINGANCVLPSNCYIFCLNKKITEKV